MKTILAMVCLGICLQAVTGNVQARWCVTSDKEMNKCQAMKTAFDGANLKQLECVRASSRFECMRRIKAGEIDLVRLDDVDIFSAGKVFGLVPIMKESFTTDPNAETFLYKAVVVVKKDGPIRSVDNLHQKKSCHTGVGRTVGWTVPVSNLQAKGVMPVKDCDNTVKTIGAFFSQSCAPGAFLPANNPEGDNPADVCRICESDQCPASDKYAGYNGAFLCLKDGRGDVAFVKHSTIKAIIDQGTAVTKSDYNLLCPDGSRKLVDQWSDCNWATRPTDVIVTSPNKPDSEIVGMRNLLEKAAAQFNSSSFNMFSSATYGGKDLMFSDGVKSLIQVSDNYKKYLDPGYMNTMTNYTNCDVTDRWCVISKTEHDKCLDMSAAFASKRITHKLTCVGPLENHKACMEKIQKGEADLVTLDGGDVYTAGKYHNLVPIVAENYGGVGADGTSYWAVAVVKKSNKAVNINTLKGKTSCHTGIQKTSGWNIPIGTLMEKGFIQSASADCNVGQSVGKFFSKSCVPGALNTKYNPRGTNPSNLCELCGGKNFCKRDNSNKFYGYKGAFRCLVEKNADVAFVKHSTVPSYTDGKLDEPWAKGLNSADFELLCPDGSRKAVTEYASCNLAKVPSHAVVTSATKSQRIRHHYFRILSEGQNSYGPSSTVYNMFSSPEGGKDALFEDSTVKFTEIDQDKQTYEKWLGDSYLGAMKNIDLSKCTSSGNAVSTDLLCVFTVMSCLMSLFSVFTN